MDTPSYVENGDGYLLTAEGMRWFWGHYCASEHRDDPRASPARAASLEGLPPAHVITAEFDPLRDEGEAYGRALRAAGVDAQIIRFDGMIHAFFSLARAIPAARPAVDGACAAIARAHGAH